jgi:hypothetical protein
MHLEAVKMIAEHAAVLVKQGTVIGVFVNVASALQTVNIKGASPLTEDLVKAAALFGKLVELQLPVKINALLKADAVTIPDKPCAKHGIPGVGRIAVKEYQHMRTSYVLGLRYQYNTARPLFQVPLTFSSDRHPKEGVEQPKYFLRVRCVSFAFC